MAKMFNYSHPFIQSQTTFARIARKITHIGERMGELKNVEVSKLWQPQTLRSQNQGLKK